MNKKITFYALGDIGPKREDADSIFTHCRSALAQADLVFGQLEPCLSSRGTPSPQARLAMRTDPSVAAAMKKVGIDVVSWASNHCMDWGTDAFADTLKNLAENQLAVIGAGQNITAARQPVIKEVDHTRIALLAYCSILPQGYWAEDDRCGCAPMRAFTVNEQIEHDQPGTPQRTHSFAHREDLRKLTADIEGAKAKADIVVVSCHWGLHFVPGKIADYQREVAHAAIDAGANLIVGHHPHILKGIEVYRGVAIFYSLGNFAIESPTAFQTGVEDSQSFQEIKSLNDNWVSNKKVLLPADSFKSCIASCIIHNKRIEKVKVIPCQINEDSQPELLSDSDPRFDEIVTYLQRITDDFGLNAKLTQHAGEVEVDLQC